VRYVWVTFLRVAKLDPELQFRFGSSDFYGCLLEEDEEEEADSSSSGISFYSWSTVFFSKFERIDCCNISVPSLFSLSIFKKCRSFVYMGTHLHLQKVPKNKHHVYN